MSKKTKKSNSKRTVDTDMPMGKLTKVEDFLPPPDKLFKKDELVRITLSVDKNTLSFFRKSSEKLGLKYQKMIREVLSGYARKYGK